MRTRSPLLTRIVGPEVIPVEAERIRGFAREQFGSPLPGNQVQDNFAGILQYRGDREDT